MTDHLPECRYVVFQQQGQIPEAVIPMGCICPALRACEQRVRDELPPNGADATWYLLGQRKGVQAARDAVEALPPIVTEDPVVSPDGELGWRERVMTWICNKDHALAAIDALREDKLS